METFAGMTPADLMVLEDLGIAFMAVTILLIVTMFRRYTRETVKAQPRPTETGRFHLRPSHA